MFADEAVADNADAHEIFTCRGLSTDRLAAPAKASSCPRPHTRHAHSRRRRDAAARRARQPRSPDAAAARGASARAWSPFRRQGRADRFRSGFCKRIPISAPRALSACAPAAALREFEECAILLARGAHGPAAREPCCRSAAPITSRAVARDAERPACASPPICWRPGRAGSRRGGAAPFDSTLFSPAPLDQHPIGGRETRISLGAPLDLLAAADREELISSRHAHESDAPALCPTVARRLRGLARRGPHVTISPSASSARRRHDGDPCRRPTRADALYLHSQWPSSRAPGRKKLNARRRATAPNQHGSSPRARVARALRVVLRAETDADPERSRASFGVPVSSASSRAGRAAAQHPGRQRSFTRTPCDRAARGRGCCGRPSWSKPHEFRALLLVGTPSRRS